MEKVLAHSEEAELVQLCEAFACLTTSAEAQALLEDVLSPKEIAAAAQRLEVARLLACGTSYVEVSHLTGASSTTVSRVSKCLNGEQGGYRLVLKRMGITE